MSEKTEILSPERLAEIGRQLEVPRARNSYVTDYGVAADVVEELYDHAAAFRHMVAAELRLLLYDESTFPQLSQQQRTACFIRNTQVKNMARILAIDLTAPTSPTS